MEGSLLGAGKIPLQNPQEVTQFSMTASLMDWQYNDLRNAALAGLREIHPQFSTFPSFLTKVKSGLSWGQTQAVLGRQVAGHAYFT